MGHIHTETGEHDWTVSAFIVRTDFDEPKLLLHRHKKLGVWLQFGGHVELKENPWQALEHEVLEESGYNLEQLNLIEPYPSPMLDKCTAHPLPISINTHAFDESATHFHTDLTYAFTTAAEPSNDLAAGESQDMRLFSLSELEALPDEEIFINVRQIGVHVLKHLVN